MRWLKHLFATHWGTRRLFPKAALDALEATIAAGERQHRGELRVVIETALNQAQVWAHITPRQRALAVFAELGVWDTAENNGVLLYILIADRAVEIVADRGYRGRVDDATWAAICAAMSGQFRVRQFGAGVTSGVTAVTAAIASAFPGDGTDANELPNRPSLI